MKTSYYQYLYVTDRKKHRYYVGCMCAVKLFCTRNLFPEIMLFGLSQCNIEEDKFNRKVGRELAEKRAINYFINYKCKESKFYDLNGHDNYISFRICLDRFIQKIMKQNQDTLITLPRNIIWK